MRNVGWNGTDLNKGWRADQRLLQEVADLNPAYFSAIPQGRRSPFRAQ